MRICGPAHCWGAGKLGRSLAQPRDNPTPRLPKTILAFNEWQLKQASSLAKPDEGLRGWLRLKEEASLRGSSSTSPTHEMKGSTHYCVEKRKHRTPQTQGNEEAPHGGSGASRVPLGGTSDGVGSAINNTTRLRLLPDL